METDRLHDETRFRFSGCQVLFSNFHFPVSNFQFPFSHWGAGGSGPAALHHARLVEPLIYPRRIWSTPRDKGSHPPGRGRGEFRGCRSATSIKGCPDIPAKAPERFGAI